MICEMAAGGGDTELGQALYSHPAQVQSVPREASQQYNRSEWSTLIGRDCRDPALIGPEFQSVEIFSWCGWRQLFMLVGSKATY